MTLPDLNANSLSVSNPTVTASGRITFSYDISNIGTGSAGASFAGLYLSTDSTITTSDQLVVVEDTPSLGSGLASAVNNAVWDLSDLMTPLTPGNYWLGVIADYPNQIAESNEGNNASNAVEITVTAAAVPDLEISNWNPSSTSGTAGSNLTVNYTVANDGNGAAGASTAGVYLSTDSSITTSDTLLGSQATSSLIAHSSVSNSTTLELPTTPGTYWLGVIADINNVVAEGSETNNASNAIQITVTAPTVTPPDLEASSLSVSNSTVADGGQLTFSYNVGNIGAGSAGASFAGLYLSTDSTSTTSDVLEEVRNTPALGSGQSSSDNNVVWDVPISLAPGNYWLGVIADYPNQIAESNEGNNASNAVEITVTAAAVPDLEISNWNPSSTSGTAGSNLTVNYTVANDGNGAAGASTAGVYLSTDSSITTSDTLLGSQATSSLIAHSSVSNSTTLELPTTPGTYWLGVIADINNVVAEGSETNNASNAIQITVTSQGTIPSSPTFSISNAGTVTEGDNAVFIVTMSGSISAPYTIWYSTFAGTASAANGDYPNTDVDQSLTFNPGEPNTQQIVIPTLVTQNAHPDTFSVGLQNTLTGGAFTTGTATIVAESGPPTFSISNAGTVTEGDNAVFIVTMSGSISAPYTIWYSTFAGTASAANGDYPNTDVDQSLTFNPGEPNTQQIVIPTLVTQNAHPDTFSVGLQNTLTGGAFTTGTATIVAAVTSPPTPTTAPATSDFPTALISAQGSAFYSTLSQQTSPNLATYLNTDTSITAPEVSALATTYDNTLSEVNDKLATADTVFGDLGDFITVTEPGASDLGLLVVSHLLSTPEAQSVGLGLVAQDLQLGISGYSVYAACGASEALTSPLDPVADTICVVAALGYGFQSLHDVTSDAIGKDPPDPDYQEVFVPASIATDPMPPTELSPSFATAAQAAITDIDQATRWIYGVDVTENRYATALAAGDANAAAMQYAAFLNYLGLYMSTAQAIATDVAGLSSQLQANAIGMQAVSTSQLSAALTELQAQGSSVAIGVLESLGFTDAEIQTMAQQVAAATAPSTAPSETADQALNDLASGFSSVTSTPTTISPPSTHPPPPLGPGDVEFISLGEIVSDTTILSGGTLEVQLGGTVEATTISQGGMLNLSGGIATGTTVNGGYFAVSSGGIADNTIVASGGEELVVIGGTASSTTVSEGGLEAVYGTVSGTIISSTGADYVQTGGFAEISVVSSGGDEFVEVGGSASGTMVDGGNQVVYGGATDTVVNDGAYLYLEAGTTTGTVVNSGVELVVGIASGTTDTSGGYDFVLAGGLAVSTTLNGGEEYIETGAAASATVVDSGGAQVVYGTVDGTVLNSDTSAYLEPGSVASGVLVNGGLAVIYGDVSAVTVTGSGYDYVEVGGSTFGTVLSAGDEYVESGASTSGTVIDNGNQVIYGTTTATVINGGSFEYLYSGGTASGTVVNSGVESIFNLAIGTIVNSGGYDYINDGRASGTVVAGGDELVEFATSAVGTLVSGAGGGQFVYGTALSATLISGGEQVVEIGGIAGATIADSGGEQDVESGGVTGDTIVQGGREWISAGGIASGTVLLGGRGDVVYGSSVATTISGGGEFVESGGTATGATVYSGAQAVEVGGSAVDTLVSGGTQYVYSGGTASGTTVDSAGEQYVEAGGVVAGAMISGGTVELTSGSITSGDMIGFAISGGGTLKLDDAVDFSGTVAGFGLSDSIDLEDIAFGANTTLGFAEAGNNQSGTLTAGDGMHTANLTLLGQYATGQFNLAADGNGGTLLTDPPLMANVNPSYFLAAASSA